MRGMLHRIADDKDVGIDLPRLLADRFHIIDIAGDVGGGHAAQDCGVLVNQRKHRIRIHAARNGICLRTRSWQPCFCALYVIASKEDGCSSTVVT